MSTIDRSELARVIRNVTDAWEEPLDEVHDVPQIVNAILAHLAEPAPLDIPALVSAEREADRLALAAARAEVAQLNAGIAYLISLDADLHHQENASADYWQGARDAHEWWTAKTRALLADDICAALDGQVQG